MEIAIGPDEEVRRGVQILDGKADSVFNNKKSQRKSRSRGRSNSPSRKLDAERPASAGGIEKDVRGLELARRRLIVVQEADKDHKDHNDEPRSPDSGTVQLEESEYEKREREIKWGRGDTRFVHIIDHGEQQKEAVRRLFGAHVHCQSYKEELNDVRDQHEKIYKDLQQEKRMRKLDIGLPRPVGEQLEDWDGMRGKCNQHWLRNDPPTRKAISAILGDIIKDGQPSRKATGEHLWTLTYAVVLRWLGSPPEELTKQCDAAELRVRRIRKEALKESAAIRDQMRIMERKGLWYKDAAEEKTRRIQSLKNQLKAVGVTPENHAADAMVAPPPFGVVTYGDQQPAGYQYGGGHGSSAGAARGNFVQMLGGGAHGGGHHAAGGPGGGAAFGAGAGFSGSAGMGGNRGGMGGGAAGGAGMAGAGFGGAAGMAGAAGAGSPGGRAAAGGGFSQGGGGPGGAGGPGVQGGGGFQGGGGPGGAAGPGGPGGFGGPGGSGGPGGPGGPGGRGFQGGGGPGGAAGFAGPAGPGGSGGPGGRGFQGGGGPGGHGGSGSPGGRGFQGGGGGPAGPGGPSGHGGAGGPGGAYGSGGAHHGPGGAAGPGSPGGAYGGGSHGGGTHGGSYGGGAYGGGAYGPGTGDMPDGPSSGAMGDTGGFSGAAAAPRQPWEVRTGKNTWVELEITDEAEDAVDNEVFEVLQEFDDDMKDMLIDVVNEKIRRLLLLDHTKFDGGNLPYGIRMDESSAEIRKEMDKMRKHYQEIITSLEEQAKEMAMKLEQAEAAKQKLRADLEAALAAAKSGGQQLMPPPQPSRSPRPMMQPPEKETVVIREPAPPQMSAGGYSEKDIRDRISEATKELRVKIAALETENGKLKKRLEELEGRISEMEKREKELERKLAAAEKAAAAAEEAARRAAERPPDPPTPGAKLHFCQFTETERIAMMNRASQCKPCTPPDSPMTHIEKCATCMRKHEEFEDNSEALARTEVALKASQGMLRKLLMKVDGMVDAPRDDSVQKPLERHLGPELGGGLSKADGSPADVNSFVGGASGEAHQNSTAAFAKWLAQTHAAMEAFKKRPPPKAPPPETKIVTVEREIVPDAPRPSTPPPAEPIIIDHTEELDRLRQKVQDQQDEISRLLLIIEELRHRFEQMKDRVVSQGGAVAEQFTEAIQEVGLEALVQAPPAYSLNLKNVYERLYQDAIQRMQRLALIMEQKAAANKLYLATMACAAARKLRGVPPPVAPDLQRLTEAALTAINGMWYHYDILFRRVCEGSAAVGVRDSASNTYRLALADCFAMPRSNDQEKAPSPFAEALWGGGSQGAEKKVASPASLFKKGTFKAEASMVRTPAPRTAETRRRRLDNEVQTPFQQYIAKMREPPPNEMGLPKTRKASTADAGSLGTLCGKRSATAGAGSLSQSLSLPALRPASQPDA